MTIETMKLALEALEAHADIGIKSDKAITALRTAIETTKKQEPVAWVNHGENIITRVKGWDGYGALYTTPPAAQRQWVGLTDRERDQFYKYVTMPDLVKAIEAKLKEKNGLQ